MGWAFSHNTVVLQIIFVCQSIEIELVLAPTTKHIYMGMVKSRLFMQKTIIAENVKKPTGDEAKFGFACETEL